MTKLGIKEPVYVAITFTEGRFKNLLSLSALKPYLSKGKIKLIAATTLDEYYKYIEKDKALVRRFRTIFINEPTKEETLTILKGIKSDYIKYYNYNIQDDLLEYIVNLTDNYVPLKTFPDKAIDVLDMACVRSKSNNSQELSLETIIEVIEKNYSVKIELSNKAKLLQEIVIPILPEISTIISSELKLSILLLCLAT